MKSKSLLSRYLVPVALSVIAVIGLTTPQILPAQTAYAAKQTAKANPLLSEWKTPFGVPPFDLIRAEHFPPALTETMALHLAEVASIAGNKQPATFSNTIEALDEAGELLERVHAVFFNLYSAETNDELEAIRRDFAPKLAAHNDDILLNADLFKRVRAVWDSRSDISLTRESERLLEETYLRFTRAGALLNSRQQKRMRAINEELAGLTTRFTEHVRQETNAFKLILDNKDQLAGLPDRLIAAAAEKAEQEGLEGKWVFTLHAPSLWPFLENSTRRDMRKKMLDAYLARGDQGNEFDNNKVIAGIAALRAEKAKLLGYGSWADFVLERTMAKNPEAVHDLLDRLWEPALVVAKREMADMQKIVDAEGGGFKVQAHDWYYYAERVKEARYGLDDAELRPFFALDRVLHNGAFYVANRLFGLTFTERPDLPVYHKEVRAFEVKEADGTHVGVFYVDYFPRSGKRFGAWASAFRKQWVSNGVNVAPVVINVGNFSRPSGEAPALLSIDEVETLFHELGHALHQLLSECRYRSLSGTSVPRDFVELPSQLMEHWVQAPKVLKTYARHWRTNEVIPDHLIEKILRMQRFNQGFRTVELVAAAKLDMDWHTLVGTKPVNTAAFELASLDRMGLIPEIPPRYRSTYFNHIVGGYAAGYYSYMWSAVLDTDAFAAFKENGIFDKATADSFRKNILSRGGTEDPMELYMRFRGRKPDVEPLLERRGLSGESLSTDQP